MNAHGSESTRRVIARLGAVKRTGAGWTATCPAHDDHRPSLSVSEGADGQTLLLCHAGCAVESVLVALELDYSDLFAPDQRPKPFARREVAVYLYRAENGRVLFEVVRYVPKGFAQRRPDGNGGYTYSLGDTRRVPYRLPELLGSRGRRVFVVEGEKDADRIAKLGEIATCNAGGAGKWRDEFASHFRDREVIIVADRDERGVAHARSVAASLQPVTRSVRVVQAFVGKDASDHLDAGKTLDELEAFHPMPQAAPAEEPENASEVRARLVCMADVSSVPVSWLWPGRIPLGKLIVLEGDPSLGKSTLALDLAARVTRGAAMPDGSSGLGVSAACVILTAEDGLADTVRPRLEAAGADLSRCYSLQTVPVVDADGNDAGERPPELPADLAELERLIIERGAKLIIIDVLNAFLSGRVDTHRDSDVRRVLLPLHLLAERTRCAIVVLRHLTKSRGSNPLYAGAGSIGIAGAARSVLLVAVDPNDSDRRVLAVTKANLARLAPALGFRLVAVEGTDASRVEWLGATRYRADDLVAQETSDERGARGEAEDFLAETLAQGRRLAREVQAEAAALGISKSTLRRAVNSLGVVSRKVGVPGGGGHWEWSLPIEGAQGAQASGLGQLEHLADSTDSTNDDGQSSAIVERESARAELELDPGEPTT